MFHDQHSVKTAKLELAAYIRGLRKARGVSRADLSMHLGLSRITIQNLESGRNITIDTLFKVLQYFDELENFMDYIAQNHKDQHRKSLY